MVMAHIVPSCSLPAAISVSRLRSTRLKFSSTPISFHCCAMICVWSEDRHWFSTMVSIVKLMVSRLPSGIRRNPSESRSVSPMSSSSPLASSRS